MTRASFGRRRPLGTGSGSRRCPAERPESDDSAAEAASSEPARAPKPERPSRPAHHYAAWLLGQREWSEKQLRERLRLKGYPETDVEQALSLLQGYDLQSDERFARSRVRTDQSRMGNRQLAYRLERSGVAKPVIEEVLETAESEDVRARNALRRFEGQPFDLKLKARAYRFLASRGFGQSTIAQAIKALAERAPRAGSSDEGLESHDGLDDWS